MQQRRVSYLVRTVSRELPADRNLNVDKQRRRLPHSTRAILAPA